MSAIVMYKVLIRGVEVHCETSAEVRSLLEEVVAAVDTTPVPPPAPPARKPPPPQTGIKDEESRWAKPAKAVVVLLVKHGKAGVDASQVATTAGIKSSKGTAPLLKAINELLGTEKAVRRKRTPEGKRWFLSSEGAPAAAKAGFSTVEAIRP